MGLLPDAGAMSLRVTTDLPADWPWMMIGGRTGSLCRHVCRSVPSASKPILGAGGYQVTLPAALEPTDSITLSFTEREGGVWGVRPFLPYVQSQSAVRSSDSRGL